MVTLLGFLFVLANVGLLVVFMPDLIGPVRCKFNSRAFDPKTDRPKIKQGPPWLYYSFAFGLFMYQTMDNLDGKQARRTGMSSGLGELFDHGIDSLNCTLGSLLETAAMGLGTSRAGVFTALCPCLPMFFSTWETYHTHTLYLGFFNGPTEGILIACAIMIISGLFGSAYWTRPVIDLLPDTFLPALARHALGPATTPADVWVGLILGSFLIGHLPPCVYHVAQARRRQNLPLAPVFLEWTPMLVYVGSIVSWLGSTHSTLMAENHLMLFCLTMSFVFGRMTTKTILAHLTRQPFPYWTILLGPLVAGALLVNFPALGLAPVFVSPRAELLYLWAYFCFAALVYSRWAYLVITSICDFLGITALTIPRQKQLENQARLRSAKVEVNGSLDGKKTQ